LRNFAPPSQPSSRSLAETYSREEPMGQVTETIERSLNDWIRMVGLTAQCRFHAMRDKGDDLVIPVKILNVKGGGSSLCLLVSPVHGTGAQWVGYKRIGEAPISFAHLQQGERAAEAPEADERPLLRRIVYGYPNTKAAGERPAEAPETDERPLLRRIVNGYPNTKAAKEAAELLDQLHGTDDDDRSR